MAYLILKWLHVTAAITLVGAHITYGVWIVRASSHPQALGFVLRNVKVLDKWISIPAYIVMITTGIVMANIVPAWFASSWMQLGIALLIVVMLAHLFVYSPTLRKMIHLRDTEGIDSANYQAAAGREAQLGIALTAVMLGIVFLMTVKPTIW